MQKLFGIFFELQNFSANLVIDRIHEFHLKLGVNLSRNSRANLNAIL